MSTLLVLWFRGSRGRSIARTSLSLLIFFVILCALAVSPASAAGTIRYATPKGLNSGACLSWATACRLQRAISVAAAGDQVWVKQGTYQPTNTLDRTISFNLKNGVAIYGGFAGTETLLSQRNASTHETILSGDLGAAHYLSDDSYHVVVASTTNSTARLDGFTITFGNADGTGVSSNGGGIFIDSASPSLRNLNILGNLAAANGGGIYVISGNPTLTGVTFNDNSAANGGGLFVELSTAALSKVHFTSNAATAEGGGMLSVDSSPSLAHVSFSGNGAANGAGMSNDGASHPSLATVTFSGNFASTEGGGLYDGNASAAFLSNVLFTGNSAPTGGGMADHDHSIPTLSNVTFKQNSATAGNGGGMVNINSDNPALSNVVFDANTASGSGGGMYNDTTSPSLNQVTFTGNSAQNGGGMYSDFDSKPALANVTFTSNVASINGGGMYGSNSNATLTGVTFSSNTAAYGGGMFNLASDPTLTNTIFDSNGAAGSGGGMLNDLSDPAITNGIFRANSAGYDGGGMYNEDTGADPSFSITDTTFSNNHAEDDGGGIFDLGSSPTITNVTLYGNYAVNDGGGMANSTDGSLHSAPGIMNATFSGNSASDNGGAMLNGSGNNPNIEDSIFWGDSNVIVSEFDNVGATPLISFSIVQGGCPGNCTYVTYGDPLLGPLANNGGFTQTMALGPASPAIDAADFQDCLATDQRGVSRPQGNTCDIGAYEAPLTVTFASGAAQDGWVLESGQGTHAGGSLSNTSQFLSIGDDAKNRQFRSILSFETGSQLPDNANINSAQLLLKFGSVKPAGTNPIILMKGIYLDIKTGFFSSSPNLQISDFQAPGSKTFGPFFPALSGGYYTIYLTSPAFAYINRLATNGGMTQIRLRFGLATNGNNAANLLNLASGDNTGPAAPPILTIVYTTP